MILTKALGNLPARMSKPSVAVLVPIYKPKPSALETIALRRRAEVLGDYPVYWIAPEGLDTTEYARYGPAETLYYSPDYFHNGATYSRLLLREDFYARFAAFEHVLVHQTDAFVFRDDLEEFCAMDFHYFGAPFAKGYAWPSYSPRGLSHIVNRFPALLPKRKVYVGNGGFSLRQVEATRRLLRDDWLASRTYRGHEDLYFATRALTRWRDTYRICDVETATRFALDEEPRTGYEHLGRRLPMGCHAWHKVDAEFWRPFLADLGYEF